MNSTDEAILTFAEAFSRLGDRKYSELYIEALATIVRMAKAEERHAAQLGHHVDDGDHGMRLLPALSHPIVMH